MVPAHKGPWQIGHSTSLCSPKEVTPSAEASSGCGKWKVEQKSQQK